ncbi:hypothetical protein SAMN05444159_0124 [Bradyrhizobium lablabi]|uniref:Uncharacterized protein n=1 Tax=Bradyrhizobium lablabi TaxID=722472 RepID=A0A1M6HW03_9BRAD|nr:hypothetical protein [Bradyrhizobium lablabi]SHJ26247.1 hypothetical protein SAMN05444159_0124 [Bradyrhizobium lablabi]
MLPKTHQRGSYLDRDGQILADDCAAWGEGTKVAAELISDLDGSLEPGEQNPSPPLMPELYSRSENGFDKKLKAKARRFAGGFSLFQALCRCGNPQRKIVPTKICYLFGTPFRA